MRNAKKYFFLFLVILFLPVLLYAQDDVKKQTTNQYSLDGAFNGGGGKYYIRQLGNDILWYGEEDAVSPTWSNVAHGIINGNTITVKWADVPKGSIMQSGNLVIRIDSNDALTLLQQTGEFFATDSWTRIQK
jgi:hypothetical protein